MTRATACIAGLLPAALAACVAGRGSPPRGDAPWSEPRALGPAINGPSDDARPTISPDGSSLYFSSNRPGGLGGLDLYVSRRVGVDAPWGPPRNLGAQLNSDRDERTISLSRDGRNAIIGTARAGGCGGMDLWSTTRANPDDDLGWAPLVNLGCVVNSPAFEDGAVYFERSGETAVYFISDRPGGPGARDVYRTRWGASGWMPPELMDGLSSPASDARPGCWADGLELYLTSERSGSQASDLWLSRLDIAHDRWSMPARLAAPVNSPYGDGAPSLSLDGKTMYFHSNRPGGLGGLDLYVTSRR